MREKPNIIVMVGDGLRAKGLGCYGNPKPTSPFIDKLAAENGVLFEDYYACTNHTDPAFTTIFSGRNSLVHGITHHNFASNPIKPETLQIMDDTQTRFLAEVLRDRGYVTVAFDWLRRWHKRGFDFYGEGKRYKGKPYGFDYVNLAKKFLSGLREPFFMMIHSWDTHTPFDTVPKRLFEQFYVKNDGEKVEDMLRKIENDTWREIAGKYHLKGMQYVDEIPAYYDAAVALFDETVEALYLCLEERHLSDNTLLVIMGDHGDNYLWDGVFVGHFSLYDPVLHTPLIVVNPDTSTPVRFKGFLQHEDVVPLILNLLDDELDLDALRRPFIFAVDGAAENRYAIRTERYKLIWSAPGDAPMVSFDTIGHRFKEELYDLKDDVEERNNIIEANYDVSSALKRQLQRVITRLKRERQRLTRSWP